MTLNCADMLRLEESSARNLSVDFVLRLRFLNDGKRLRADSNRVRAIDWRERIAVPGCPELRKYRLSPPSHDSGEVEKVSSIPFLV